MDFLELAKKRYSVRKFREKPVESEKLDLVLQAGLLAPTACNNQPERILVVDDAGKLEQLKKCTPYTFGAPVVLMVCYDRSKSWKRGYDGDDSGAVDAAVVTTHLMLETAALGLGCTWVGSFDPAAVRREFSLPQELVPVALLPLGYPETDAAPSAQHGRRNPREEIVFRNHF